MSTPDPSYISTGLRENKFMLPERCARFVPARGFVAARRGACIDCHIGSQITDLAVRVKRRRNCSPSTDRGRRTVLAHVDVGVVSGSVTEEEAIDLRRMRHPRARARESPPPAVARAGRLLVGNAGILLTRVLYLKPGDGRDCDRRCRDERRIRPALRCLARGRAGAHTRGTGPPLADRRPRLRAPTSPTTATSRRSGRLIAIRPDGAYAFAMSPTTNSPARPRSCRRRRADASGPARETSRRLFASESRSLERARSTACTRVRVPKKRLEPRNDSVRIRKHWCTQGPELAEKSCNPGKCG